MSQTVIFGCEGLTLNAAERDFFTRVQPLGFILFERNCKDPQQVRQLVHDLKSCVEHTQVPILIDQEGGRVVRLKPPHWRPLRAAYAFTKLADQNLKTAQQAVYDHAYLTGRELIDLGINTNCAPCLDLNMPGADAIIGDRSYGEDVERIVVLGKSYMQGLSDAGVMPVIKHLPGHGRAPVDSHLHLPEVTTPLGELLTSDFDVFRRICEESTTQPFWGMSAHVVYSAIDALPATISPHIIEHIIRQKIGFKGLLMSDCLTMKALQGTLAQRAQRALAAGCHVALHCSGRLDEMMEVISGVSAFSQQNAGTLHDLFTHHTQHIVSHDISMIEARLEKAFL